MRAAGGQGAAADVGVPAAPRKPCAAGSKSVLFFGNPSTWGPIVRSFLKRHEKVYGAVALAEHHLRKTEPAEQFGHICTRAGALSEAAPRAARMAESACTSGPTCARTAWARSPTCTMAAGRSSSTRREA